MYDETFPVFQKRLTALAGVLDIAEAHCAEKKIEPEALLRFRLYPDMWHFHRQVSAATDHVRRCPVRLTGTDPVAMEDSEMSFDGLRDRIAASLDYLDSFDRATINGTAGREVRFPVGPREMVMTGADYVRDFILPNFYFHVTTAYVILRHNGVPLSKVHFLGDI